MVWIPKCIPMQTNSPYTKLWIQAKANTSMEKNSWFWLLDSSVAAIYPLSCWGSLHKREEGKLSKFTRRYWWKEDYKQMERGERKKEKKKQKKTGSIPRLKMKNQMLLTTGSRKGAAGSKPRETIEPIPLITCWTGRITRLPPDSSPFIVNNQPLWLAEASDTRSVFWLCMYTWKV